jgi:hypothetical protein
MLASPIQPGNCWTIQPVAGYHPHAAPTWSKERVRRVGESARIVSREGRGVSDGDQSPSIESSAVQLSALSVTIREPLVTDVGQLGVQRNPVVRNRKSYGVPKSREVVGAGECVAAPARQVPDEGLGAEPRGSARRYEVPRVAPRGKRRRLAGHCLSARSRWVLSDASGVKRQSRRLAPRGQRVSFGGNAVCAK